MQNCQVLRRAVSTLCEFVRIRFDDLFDVSAPFGVLEVREQNTHEPREITPAGCGMCLGGEKLLRGLPLDGSDSIAGEGYFAGSRPNGHTIAGFRFNGAGYNISIAQYDPLGSRRRPSGNKSAGYGKPLEPPGKSAQHTRSLPCGEYGIPSQA